MHVTTHKTKKVRVDDNLYKILDESLPKLREKSVVVISSKIVALCQGRVVKQDGKHTKEDFLAAETEWYIDPKTISHGYHISIKYHQLISSGGIDVSNTDGYFVFWPREIQKTTNDLWHHLRKQHQIKHLGIILSDSRLNPLRWGVTGIGISHCGFLALNDFRGKPDVFGVPLKVTQIAVKDALAAAAVVQMGESNEQTPLSVVSEVPFVQFQTRPPSKKELAALIIDMENDVFAPFLRTGKWIKGKSKVKNFT